MTKEWYAICKDCGERYGYSDHSQQVSYQKGLSRPERCPECRKKHAREIRSVGISHYDLVPVQPIPESGLKAGKLGGLMRPKRVHELQETSSKFDFDKFGIKDHHILEYFEILQRHQVSVIVAPTGAGKSTFLPYRLMKPPYPLPENLFTRNGQIIVTQPRIQATRNIPLFVARDLNGSNLGPGFDVGFRHHGAPATDWRNKLVYMTDGTLINIIVRNQLGNLSVIMIDEAHERSVNIDLILGMLKLQLLNYPRLKLIIASATIDSDLFINYFGGSEKVGFYEFPGKRRYPVDTQYRMEDPIPENQWPARMPEEAARKVIQILRDMQTEQEPARGDILAFLHGEKPIEKAVGLIKEEVENDPRLNSFVDVLPLYTKLPQRRQDAALRPKDDLTRVRVIVSTNVAETSLTVDGIVHVVDSGLINESQWDPQTQTIFVIPKIHSQAGCQQRWGRAGRIRAGIAHCLYTEAQFQNFPKHTDPEILRAPLEQIVLTAKAAGVADIQKFDWIQRPSQEELERAPLFLQRIGAIDSDGDLTEHGLELQSYAEDTDIANLMILADRFGLAVEMATYIAMLKIGSISSFLLWDRGWSAETKYRVHQLHAALAAPCEDDLEFCLKLWSCWNGSLFNRASTSQRQNWARHYFVNHSVFSTKVEKERETLLQPLSGHRKTDSYRPIDFDLLTRLRMLITYGLKNQIYLRGHELSDQVSNYEPYIYDREQHPELVHLHEDARVSMSDDSICARQSVPAFVCASRRRIRRRLTPLAEPETVIAASFIVAIKTGWLDYLELSPIALAKAISVETRDLDGILAPAVSPAGLFIDQRYPLRSSYSCRYISDTHEIDLISRKSDPPLIAARQTFEDIEPPEDLEVLTPETVLDEAAGSLREKEGIALIDENGSLEAIDLEDQSQEKGTDISGLKEQYFAQQLAGICFDARESFQHGKVFVGAVAGYDFSDQNQPRVQISTHDEAVAFMNFCELYHPSDTILAVVEAVETYPADRLVYAIIHEKQTGLHIFLDPYDVSLMGRNFAVELLEPGDEIRLTVEEIDTRRHAVSASRLKEAQAVQMGFISRFSEKTVDARIMEASDQGLYLWLDPESTRENLPVCAFAYIKYLPQRPEELRVGQTCRVRVRPEKSTESFQRTIHRLTESDLNAIASLNFGGKIKWDEINRSLLIHNRLTYTDRMRLLGATPNGEFQRTVRYMFRRTNQVRVEVLDMAGLKEMSRFEGADTSLRWTITEVRSNGLRVRSVEGLDTFIPKEQALFNTRMRLEDKYKAGQEVDLKILSVNMDTGFVWATALIPANDPLKHFFAGQSVQGKVVGIKPYGAFVEIDPEVSGLVHISKISKRYLKGEDQIREVVKEGDLVDVKILNIENESRKVSLSMCE